MLVIIIKNGKIIKKGYKTYMNGSKAAMKAVKENAEFVATKYDDGEEYIYNKRTGLFVRTK